MKKIILLATSLATSLLMAEEPSQELLNDIAKAKETASVADAKLKALQSKLPQNQDIMTKLKLGYIKTDGNSNTETFSLDGDIKKEWGNNSLKLSLDAQYGNTDIIDANNVTKNEETKNKYFTELEYAYSFSDKLSTTLVLGYKDDKFSSYNYQSYIGPGVKYKAYKSDKQELNAQASLLYSHDQIQEQYLTTTDLKNNYGSYKATFTYELQIFENLKFNQELSYRAAVDESQNYFVFSKSEISSKISNIFSAGLSYKVDYANLVAETIEKRDNTLAAFISLEY